MKKLAAATVALGVLTASCSGGHAGSFVPAGPSQAQSQSSSIASDAPEGQLRSTKSVATAAVPAGWAATATQAFPLKNATDEGKLSASKPLTVHVGLNLRNASGLQSLARSGGHISPAEFKAQYAPTGAQVAQVTKYLQGRGLTGVTVEPNNLIVSATGTTANVEAAFDTTLHAYSQNGKTRVCERDAGVRAELAERDRHRRARAQHRPDVHDPDAQGKRDGRRREAALARVGVSDADARVAVRCVQRLARRASDAGTGAGPGRASRRLRAQLHPVRLLARVRRAERQAGRERQHRDHGRRRRARSDHQLPHTTSTTTRSWTAGRGRNRSAGEHRYVG